MDKYFTRLAISWREAWEQKHFARPQKMRNNSAQIYELTKETRLLDEYMKWKFKNCRVLPAVISRPPDHGCDPDLEEIWPNPIWPNPPDKVQQSFAIASCVKAGHFSEASDGIFEDVVVEVVSRSSPCLGTRASVQQRAGK